jgi:hypothetical protein
MHNIYIYIKNYLFLIALHIILRDRLMMCAKVTILIKWKHL